MSISGFLKNFSVESDALNGRVFDILGEVFEGISLKDLLLEAIRYGDQPEVRARLGQRVENAFDRDNFAASSNATPSRRKP